MTTFARACPVSLSRNPLSPGIEATPKTDLSLSRSLVHRQTWRLTGLKAICYSGRKSSYGVAGLSVVRWAWLRVGWSCHLATNAVDASGLSCRTGTVHSAHFQTGRLQELVKPRPNKD